MQSRDVSMRSEPQQHEYTCINIVGVISGGGRPYTQWRCRRSVWRGKAPHWIQFVRKHTHPLLGMGHKNLYFCPVPLPGAQQTPSFATFFALCPKKGIFSGEYMSQTVCSKLGLQKKSEFAFGTGYNMCK